MQKKSIFMAIMVATICCFTLFLTGCNANSDNNDYNHNDVNVELHTPEETPTTTPNEETQTTDANQIPDTYQTSDETYDDSLLYLPLDTDNYTDTTQAEEPTPNVETPPVETTSPVQTEPPTQAEPPTQPPTTSGGTLVTGLGDGTQVRLMLSGRELTQHWAIIIGDEVLIPDFSYVFGNLLDAGGVERLNFWGLSAADMLAGTERAVIFNDSYNISIYKSEYSFTVNDVTLPLTVPAQTLNGTLHLPLVAIANAIGATVEWNEAEQMIHFFMGGN